MKVKTKLRRPPLSRKTKVALYTISILVMGVLIGCFTGVLRPNWQQRYHRVEKAHFIGPAQILGREEVSGKLYDEVVLAETADAVIVTTISMYKTGNDNLLYLPKKGKITVTGAPHDPFNSPEREKSLTVFVVDDYPEAVYAELDLCLMNSGVYADAATVPIFYLTAQRQTEGYFRMDIPLKDWPEGSQQGVALREFNICSWGIYITERSDKAQVRLYDRSGQLIAEETVKLFD